MRQTRNGKAAGEVGILSEISQESGETLLHELEIRFYRCHVDGEISIYCSNTLVVVIYK